MKFIANSLDVEKYLNIDINEYFLIKNISTDTRSMDKDSFFIAIKGDRFNGNDYVEEAFNKGAALALVDDPRFANVKNNRIIYVRNTIKALATMSENIINNYDGKVIAITGSNGKTTTTNIIASTLESSSSTLANFNNDIGLPLSIFNSSPKSKYLVYEIGASKFNDINYLSKILKPDIGVITNIGLSHLDFLKNKEGVLKVKSEIIKNIKKDGFLIVPDDDKSHLKHWKSMRSDINIVTFGLESSSDFHSSDINFKTNGVHFSVESKYLDQNKKLNSKLEGNHNVINILASCAVHYCLKKNINEITKNIGSVIFHNSRSSKIKWIKGSILIDDTYNANPDSARKSIDLLSNYSNKTYMILGDMLELGRYKKKLHKEIGQYAKIKGIDIFIGFGELAKNAVDGFGNDGLFFKEELDLKNYLKQNISKKDVILIKGSRGMKMERFINV
jgi:UDP-N-acetylmuramoyl-tripeptide--D-alanyl-D-alanine ligase